MTADPTPRPYPAPITLLDRTMADGSAGGSHITLHRSEGVHAFGAEPRARIETAFALWAERLFRESRFLQTLELGSARRSDPVKAPAPDFPGMDLLLLPLSRIGDPPGADPSIAFDVDVVFGPNASARRSVHITHVRESHFRNMLAAGPEFEAVAAAVATALPPWDAWLAGLSAASATFQVPRLSAHGRIALERDLRAAQAARGRRSPRGEARPTPQRGGTE